MYVLAMQLDHMPTIAIALYTPSKVEGLISKFVVGAGRTSVVRQFFFANGPPYNTGKVCFYSAVEYIVLYTCTVGPESHQ